MIAHYTQILTYIILSAFGSVYFVEMTGVMDVVKRVTKRFWFTRGPRGQKWPRRLKPFDCSKCLSFWICLYLTTSNITLVLNFEAVGYACVAGVFSVWIVKKVKDDRP